LNVQATHTSLPGFWRNGAAPENASLGTGTVITGELAFKRFRASHAAALVVGSDCAMDGVHFNLGNRGSLAIGSCCYFTNVVLLCELEIRIGSYVVIGWNSTIADTDFHPLEPAARIADAIACSPLAKGAPRPPIAAEPIVIGDNVWIGANATIAGHSAAIIRTANATACPSLESNDFAAVDRRLERAGVVSPNKPLLCPAKLLGGHARLQI